MCIYCVMDEMNDEDYEDDDELFIPKGFLTGIMIPSGPMEGKLAQPCLCGYPTEIDGDRVLALIQWHDGRLMLCHEECVRTDEETFYA